MNWNRLKGVVLLVLAMSISTITRADVVWIDVRSVVEHKIDHIKGDIRISHKEIIETVSAKFPEKNTKIRLYCRSGWRAEKALIALQEAGYSDVKNLGSIENARIERGISTEK